jgi:hypothetical protein
MQPNVLSRRRLAQLGPNESGAIVVFGIFFAVFVVGMLYYMVGLGNAIYYRERLQDAADASAFGAAVVHARGMNTMALINMIMAAVLAILFTLKLVESLIAVATVVLAVLAIFGGATAGVATALEQVRQKVHSAANTAKTPVMQALAALHSVGRVVKVITPIGSNATVLGRIADQYEHVKLAVAIPSRLTLPVEDDEFGYLCRKSGIMAGKLAMLPLSPILPGFVERAVQRALGSLAEAAPGWFCGEGGAAPPKVELEPQVEGRPISNERKACAQYKPAEGSTETDNTGVELCNTAERVDMMATPDATTGLCRVGQIICVETREDPNDPSSPVTTPAEGTYCAGEGSSTTLAATDCPEVDADGNLTNVRASDTPYGRRLQQSRSDCRPTDSTRAYAWIERTVTVEWTYDPNTNTWSDERTESPERLRTPANKDDRTTPCRIGMPPLPFQQPSTATWNAQPDLSRPVCTLEEAAPSGPPIIGQPSTMTREHVEVKQVLSCGQYVPGRTISLDQVNMDDITGGDNGSSSPSDNQNKNPFRFEKGHMLGTSDMQIRALVIGDAITETRPTQNSDNVVENTRWLPPGQEGQQAGGFLGTVRDWGRLTTAQAEYYFDPRGLNSDDPFADLNKQRDWLWVMGWSARLRRFRMSFDGTDADGNAINADGPSRKGDSEDDKGLAQELSDNEMFESLSGDGPACERSSDAADCNENASLLSRFDKLFLH